MLWLALSDLDLSGSHPVIHVRRPVRVVQGVPCFAPAENRQEHAVPLATSLVPVLAHHIDQFPPVPVTLPWKVPDGDPLRFRLIVTRPDSRPWKGQASTNLNGTRRKRRPASHRPGPEERSARPLATRACTLYDIRPHPSG